jgi:hypothetical protein
VPPFISIFQPYTQGPFHLVEEGTQQLTQANFELGAALAVTLVFTLMLQQLIYSFTPQFVSDRNKVHSPLNQKVNYMFRA